MHTKKNQLIRISYFPIKGCHVMKKKIHFDFVLNEDEAEVIFEGIRNLISNELCLKTEILAGYNPEDPEGGKPLNEEVKAGYIEWLEHSEKYLENIIKKIKYEEV